MSLQDKRYPLCYALISFTVEFVFEAVPREHTRIVIGAEEIIRITLENIAKVRHHIYTCGDKNWPAANVRPKPIVDAFYDAKRRGIPIKFITEVTRENIPYVRENMKFAEVRHLGGIKGNFGCSEFAYQGNPTVPEAEPVFQLIVSYSKTIVDQGNYIFETLWEKAVPAEEKIREIEEGIEVEFFETIRDSEKLLQSGGSRLQKAEREILILFSSAAGFHRQKKTGLFDFLGKKIRRHKKMIIRVLTPMDDEIRNIAEKLEKNRIIVKGIEPQSQTRISLSIIDRKYCISAELKDDIKNTSNEAAGLGFHTNNKSTVLSYISVFDTLWTQAELYERLRDLNEQLQSNDRLQKEFINVAAHELRTPIQPILGLSQALRDNSGARDHREFLDAIVRNAKRLNKLSEDVLQVSRIESNLLKLNYEQFDIGEVIGDVVKSAKQNTRDRRIRFKVQAKKNRVSGDRTKIEQVIGNLVDNAVKFTASGTITVDARQKGRQVMVSVKDGGRGIHPDIMPRLFTKFASKSDGGTGLGLYICKKIVEAHGGEISAENNRRAKGATFRFCIPVKSIRLTGMQS